MINLKAICESIKSLTSRVSKLEVTTLYESSTENYGTVNLNKNTSNFSRVKIYAKSRLTQTQIVKEVVISASQFCVDGMEYDNSGKKSRNYCTNYTISNNTISVIENVYFDRNYSSGNISGNYDSNNVSIYKVEGIK